VVAYVVRAESLVGHRVSQQPGDPDPGSARSGKHEPGVGEAAAGRPQRGDDAGQDDRGRALDIVVERRRARPVPVEDPECVLLLEVLPLDQTAWPDLLDPLDEGLDELVVRGAPKPGCAVAEVERVLEQGRLSVPTSSETGSVSAG